MAEIGKHHVETGILSIGPRSGTGVAALRHPTARRSTTPSRVGVTPMTMTVKSRDNLDRRTAQEIARFLRARQVTLAGLIRRGLGERQGPSGEDSDEVALASRTLDDEVQAALVDRASRELHQVNAALDLLEEQRYGLCRECGGFIGLPRLRSLPFAQRCRPCQGQMERRQAVEPRRSLAAVGAAEVE
jgi:RNA polymerase-binding transcription factor DksA